MANFIVEFPLQTRPYQEIILDKRFEIARRIYNALANKIQKRYKEMVKTKRYKALMNSLTGDKKHDKPIWKQVDQIRKDFRFTEYAFHADVKRMQQHFKSNVDAFIAQKIATHLWRAYYSLFYGTGKEVHFKKFGNLNSVEGKSNNTGIRFLSNHIYWNRLCIPVEIDYNNLYEYQALQNEISYCRIVRRSVRGKFKYYVQLVFKGIPPVKINKQTGEIKHPLGKGDIRLDIGTSTLAVSSATKVELLELADQVQVLADARRRYQRKLDRSRRATNTDNYNDDGTIKGGKKTWVRSKSYMQTLFKLKELSRKEAAIRRYQHQQLANDILALGDNIYVEDMDFAALQKRSKNTTANSKGKYNSKKRFGKSIANRAPAMLLTIIDQKLKNHGKELVKIDTKKAKASQYNHFDGNYNKKVLSQRWNDFNGIKVQRDLYSAFLIMNTNDTHDGFNTIKCNDRFDDFLILHDKAIEDLIEEKETTGKKVLSSIGI